MKEDPIYIPSDCSTYIYQWWKNRNQIEEKEADVAYSVLIDDIDDHNELPVILSIVHESHSPNLHISLERLQIQQIGTKEGKQKKKQIQNPRVRNGRFKCIQKAFELRGEEELRMRWKEKSEKRFRLPWLEIGCAERRERREWSRVFRVSFL